MTSQVGRGGGVTIMSTEEDHHSLRDYVKMEGRQREEKAKGHYQRHLSHETKED